MLAGQQAAAVLFVYCCGVDETGHLSVLMGSGYRQAIDRVDAHVGGRRTDRSRSPRMSCASSSSPPTLRMTCPVTHELDAGNGSCGR